MQQLPKFKSLDEMSEWLEYNFKLPLELRWEWMNYLRSFGEIPLEEYELPLLSQEETDASIERSIALREAWERSQLPNFAPKR